MNEVMVSRRSFVKSAAAVSILASASPPLLMAETKEGMPQRILGRTRAPETHARRNNIADGPHDAVCGLGASVLQRSLMIRIF